MDAPGDDDVDVDAQRAFIGRVKKVIREHWDTLYDGDSINASTDAPYPEGRNRLLALELSKRAPLHWSIGGVRATDDLYAIWSANDDVGISPPFNPVIFRQPNTATGELVLHYFAILNPKYRRTGLGRLAINAIQQAMTDAHVYPERLRVAFVHFPTFYVVDSHYGWLPIPGNHATARDVLKAPPGKLYPPHLRPRNAEERRENAVVTYTGRDMAWCPPQVWAAERFNYVTVPENNRGRDYEDITAADLLRVPEAIEHLRSTSRQLANRETQLGQGGGGKEERGETLLRLVSLRRTLEPVLGTALVDDLVASLVELGNDDEGVKGLLETDALAIVYHLTATAKSGSDIEALLALAFAIDYGRVMYRPVVMTAATMARLLDLCRRSTLAGVFGDHTDFMPVFTPYFAELGGWWLWVPVRKPHSTSNYQGTDIVPLPKEEPEPVFVTLAKEKLGRAKRPAAAADNDMPSDTQDTTSADEARTRGAKRPRLEAPRALDFCAHCRRPAPGMATVMSAFCDAACHAAYMHGHQ